MDTEYKLLFRAYNTNGNNVRVRLLRHGSPYANYGLSKGFYLSQGWETYEKEFTTTSGDKTDARLTFLFSDYDVDGMSYFIDDVVIEKVGEEPDPWPGAPSGLVNITATWVEKILEVNCFDGIDNNDNGLTDCADPDCNGITNGLCDTGRQGICAEGTIICQDGVPACVQNNQQQLEGPFDDVTCFDTLDNDCDGDVDVADTDCAETLSITLEWNASSGSDGYRMFVRKAGYGYDYDVPYWEGPFTTCVLFGLPLNTDLYFVVRAYNEYGESGDSNEVLYEGID